MHNEQFFEFWVNFCLLTLLTTQKIKILKKWKNVWRYCHFTLVYHKWQSYDVWFLRYGAWKTESLVILDIFCPFTSLTTQKNLNFEKMNETPGGIIILYKCPQNHIISSVPKIMIICFTVPEIWHILNVIFIFHFELFFTLLPT